MDGHTLQLGPHEVQKKKDNFDPSKHPLIELKETREHVLILMILLFFSANVAFAFISYASPSAIVDTIHAPDFLASVSQILDF